MNQILNSSFGERAHQSVAVLFAILLLAVGFSIHPAQSKETFDIVLTGGRVIDPETRLDGPRNVGIKNGKIVAISRKPLSGVRVIDVAGLVVAPGFIDMHAHGQDETANRLQALDGVTTALELEGGTDKVAETYAAREGKSVLNFGYSASHARLRTRVLATKLEIENLDTLEGAGALYEQLALTSATPSDESLIQEAIGNALDEGALGIGFGLAYTPGAGRSEVFHLFEMAARRGAPIIVHVRSIVPEDISPEPELQQMQEVVANAAATGVRLHICHVSSTGVGVTPQILELIDGARARGVDVTTEAYPYTAGSTSLTSTIFLPGWQKKVGGVSFDSLVWVKTGERLTETTFKKYREEAMKSGESAQVIIHFIPESAMDVAISHPDVIVASDGGSWRTGREHPRGAGTFSRVLSRYVREKRAIDLVGALRKMTILPAQRLEQVAPQMKKKGRLQEGADADVAVFDPEKIIDKGTYESPMQPSEGVRYLLVNGVLIVDSGVFASGVYPGRAVRGSLSSQ